MIKVIQHLKMVAEDYRNMSTPNTSTITEYTANKNRELALEFEVAAEALRKLYNEGFNEGILAGLTSLTENCKARRNKIERD